MDDTLNQDELTPDDLAVIQAFDALDMQNWEREAAAAEIGVPAPVLARQEDDDAQPASLDLLSLFVAEVDEDMTIIRRTLHHVESNDQVESGRLRTLQRMAHKIKGTAGAMGCQALSTLAYYMEELSSAVMGGALAPSIGLPALAKTAAALTETLNSVVTYGKENPTPLVEFEAAYKALPIDRSLDLRERGDDSFPSAPDDEMTSLAEVGPPSDDDEEEAVRISFKAPDEGMATGAMLRPPPEHSSGLPFVRVDVRRFEQLVLHTEQLAELRSPLEHAQADVEKALQELQAAQARLRHLETVLSTTLTKKASARAEHDVRPPSSLVARILHESGQRSNAFFQRSTQAHLLQISGSSSWDGLEIDAFSEGDLLVRSFNEAVTDVATASAQLRLAFVQLNQMTQKHVHQAAHVRNDMLLLRQAPMSTLITRIERAVSMSALAQQRKVQFTATGETIEIDQDILEDVKHPLLQLVRTCLASSFPPPMQLEQPTSTDRVWLSVRAVGSEVTIEVGFSMAVSGGALEEAAGWQEALALLHGSMRVQRNTLGGISFHLRLPRTQGAVQGLLIRVGGQRLLVPFSQVQHIDVRRQEPVGPVVSMNALLGFPVDASMQRGIQPLLILQSGSGMPALEVDEVLGDVELVVKPLSPHLQRPGIIGAAIDSAGHVILVVNGAELVRYWAGKGGVTEGGAMPEAREIVEVAAQSSATTNEDAASSFQKLVLVADDSVYIRKSLLQTLTHAGYRVMEAHDGLEALELLMRTPPDVLMLDLEMPNLNGYDLLNIMRIRPQLARVKVVMLSSRISEKHTARARELGAHAYLTKPCPQETLLETLKYVLTQ